MPLKYSLRELQKMPSTYRCLSSCEIRSSLP
eukprot:Gb_35197 [translate_table: standard]